MGNDGQEAGVDAPEAPEDVGFEASHHVDAQWVPAFAAQLLHDEGDDDEKEFGEPALARALLTDAARRGCSDVHIDPHVDGVCVRLRLNGVLHQAALLPEPRGRRLLGQLRTMSGLDPTLRFRPDEARCSIRIEGRALDLRLVAVPCLGGEKLSIRVLDRQRMFRNLSTLGLGDAHRERIEEWLVHRTGMLLAVGPAGSGKTSTLYALLHQLAESGQAIVSIEDPAEHRIDGVSQIQVDEEHGVTFARGLKNMLRLDPDCLCVGEIRDPESARIAVTASVTGHVLLSTLHGADAVGAVTSLRNRAVPDPDIADALRLVVNQRLVPRLCEGCRRPEAPSEADTAWLRALGHAPPERTWRSAGCDACGRTGHRGRTGIFEVWKPEPGLRERIAAGDDEHALRRTLREAGHATLLDDALSKVVQGVVGLAQLRRVPDLAIPVD